MNPHALRSAPILLALLVACDAAPPDEDELGTSGEPALASDDDEALELQAPQSGQEAPDPSDGGVEPWDPGLPPPMALDRLVGVGIAGQTGRAYAWTSLKVVSAGLPEQLTYHRSPYRYSTSVSSGVVDMAISSVDRTYVWFANGTAGRGSTSDPTSIATWAYTLPGGRVPADIVGVAILKSSDTTYAYYDDGTYSRGSTSALGSVSCCTAYSLPPGKTADDIVGMDFAPGGKLHTWFDDGTYSVGTSTDLDAYQAPRRYARHGMLASRWPADAPNVTSGTTSWPPINSVADYTGPVVLAPEATTFDVPVGGSSFDLIAAAGHDAVGIAFDASVYFYDKAGNPLSGGGLTASGKLPLDQMFAEFVRPSPVVPGQEAPNDVNQYVGFPAACDGPEYPTTLGNGYCVSSAPYDTRVHFDPVGGRFVILANLRNRLWTNYFGNKYDDPDLSDEELYELDYDEEIDGCGAYSGPSGTTAVPEGEHCKLARRLMAIAVSRTDDPRDGFFTWVFVENRYRDWPWMAIDDDWVILSSHGDEDPASPATTLVSLADLRAGKARPQYVHYFASDLGGRTKAEPPQQLGTWSGRSLVVDVSDTSWWMFALPHPPQPYDKQPAKMLATTLTDAPGFSRERAVFRGGRLHLMGQIENDVEGEPDLVESKVKHVRVPLWLSSGVPTISTSTAQGYKATLHYPGPGRRLDEPVAAVNGAGEVLFAWGYSGVDPSGEVAPRVEHTMLRKGASSWDTRRVFRAGDGFVEGYPSAQIKAIATAVDPIDDRTFWVVHKYGTAGGNWGVVMGSVDPAP